MSSIYYLTSALLVFNHCCISLSVPTFKRGIEQQEENRSVSENVLVTFIGVSFVTCSIICIIACACCKGNNFFKWTSSQRSSHSRNGLGSSQSRSTIGDNNNELYSDISVFQIPEINNHLSSSTSQIYFEPLPDIGYRLQEENQQVKLSASVSSNLNEDWFAEPYKNFPRSQLQYVRKLGKGWFGQVLEGRAIGVDTDHTSTVITSGLSSKSTSVVVKSLREDASSQEQAFFLQELIPYRDLDHVNVLKIVAYCLETQPLLVLLQFCPKGDLKNVLVKDSTLTDAQLLKMVQDVASGLSHMHHYDFIHTDLAARNCLVDENLLVKIGDYGFTIEAYKNEYYLAENVALPIRWCAPETLRCTETTIETIELTKAANVWSFGVLLWEVLTKGKIPYEELDEDSVIQQVVLERTKVLSAPASQTLHSGKLDSILHLCWLPALKRPDMNHFHSLLNHLCSNMCPNDSSIIDFEKRWNQLSSQPSPQDHSICLSNALDMRFESDFNPEINFEIGKGSSPSLKNFHGSAEDLDAKITAKFGSAFPSWLGLEPGQPLDSLTEEISDAIQRLDEALAGEKSEPSSSITSPDKSDSVNFRIGRDSLVLNPPGGTLSRCLSDGEEDNLTMRLEQGDFSELVRLKSQSVQDFMRLTVVDDGSDSDKNSQPGSFTGDFNACNLIPEKNFSSESNLKEAIRDAGFMVELEKLHADHKYSIISEVSREGHFSMEFSLYEKDNSVLESQHNEKIFDNRTGNSLEAITSASGESFFEEAKPPLQGKEKELSTKTEIMEECNVSTLCEASPDCIVSSKRGLNSTSLPDIVVHDKNINFFSLSSSSSDDGNLDYSNQASTCSDSGVHTSNSHEEYHLNPTEKIIAKEKSLQNCVEASDKGDTSEEISDDFVMKSSVENVIQELSNETNNYSIPEEATISNGLLLGYSPEEVVQGEEVVFGASDDFSLELFKPLRSVHAFIKPTSLCNNELKETHSKMKTAVDFAVDKESNSNYENCLSDCNKNDNQTLQNNDENLVDTNVKPCINQKEGTLIWPKSTNECDHNFNNQPTENICNELDCGSDSTIDNCIDSYLNSVNGEEHTKHEQLIPNSPNFSIDVCNTNHNLLKAENVEDSKSKSAVNVISCTNNQIENNESINLLNSNSELILKCPGTNAVANTLNNSLCVNLNKNSVTELSEDIDFSHESKNEQLTYIEGQMGGNVENGAFWERQMAAWKEAAEQTRELLHQAANGETETSRQHCDYDFEVTKSPQTPRSDEESSKSPYSSTDLLDTDDEGTYVSYDTTDDDEAVRYNPDDINALRSELCLKLTDISEPNQQLEEETSNDVLFINYKGARPTTLSPIKEEHIVHDQEVLEYEDEQCVNNISEMEENSSIEFTEGLKFGEGNHEMFIGEENFYVSPSDFKLDVLDYALPNICLSNKCSDDVSFDLSGEEAKDSLILEDLDNDTPSLTRVIGPISNSESNDDLLLVDTETNSVTLIDSGRPQSHLAFLVEKMEETFPALDMEIVYDTADDVAPESLPYEDSSGKLAYTTLKADQNKKNSIDEGSPMIDCTKESEVPHYQSYFTSALSSISQPTSSLDGKEIYKSEDHISLPYDVNFASALRLSDGENNSLESSPPERKRKFSSECENEALILEEPGSSSETSSFTNPFVTLSFLGRLYNEEGSTEAPSINHEVSDGDTLLKDNDAINSGQYNSSPKLISCSKTETDSSDSDTEIEEQLPFDNLKKGMEEQTPIRTPSHLPDFVWRSSSDAPEQRYTPDWETDADSETNEDMESSSTSGEFVWQPGDAEQAPYVCYPSEDKTSLEWSLANEERREENEDSSTEEDSESGEEDFTPSTWNRELTPQRSLLKSPETNSGEKKSVHWKHQRHHRVYEYPPEPQSWHAEIPATTSRRTWGGHSLDYLTLADWELAGEDFLGDESEDFEEFFPKGGRSSMNVPQIYSLAPLTFDKASDGMYGDNCDFFMGSSGSEFGFSRSSFTPSDFFPGSAPGVSYDFLYPDTDDRLLQNSATINDSLGIKEQKNEIKVLDSDSVMHELKGRSAVTEEAKLSREKLRLDLPTICLQEGQSEILYEEGVEDK